MNLTSTIKIYAGGVGSGCKGKNCGRPRLRFEKSGTKNEVILYHGTTLKNLDSILNNGLVTSGKGGRDNLYLSRNKEVAHWAAAGEAPWVPPKWRNKDGVVFAVKANIKSIKYTNKDPEEIKHKGLTAQLSGEFETVTSGMTIPTSSLDLEKSFVVLKGNKDIIPLKQYLSKRSPKK